MAITRISENCVVVDIKDINPACLSPLRYLKECYKCSNYAKCKIKIENEKQQEFEKEKEAVLKKFDEAKKELEAFKQKWKIEKLESIRRY